MQSRFLASAAALVVPIVLPAAASAQTSGASTSSTEAGVPQKAAQSAPAELGEIIVTANRRSENVQKVAATISVIGGESLTSSGITRSNEISQVVPNVTISSTYSNTNPRIFIRGVGTADFNPNAASPVGVYVDDVYIASTNAIAFNLFDIQRVEVLSGPQGTLYGRNTTAGAIKYFSKMPTDRLSGDITVRGGNLGDAFVEAALSGPLAGDALTGRVAFTAERRDGYMVNRLTGKSTGNDIRTWAGRGILKWEPSSDWRFVLNVHGGRSNPHTATFKSRGTLTATGQTCSLEAQRAYECYDVLGYRDTPDLRSNAINRVGREVIENYGGSLSIDKDFDWAKLSSITAYNRVHLTRVEDTDSSPNESLEFTYDQTSYQVTQELRLASPGGDRLNWIIGAYYFFENVDYNNQYDSLRALRPSFGFDPSFGILFADHFFHQKNWAYAAFGRADYAITDKLKLTAGLRYTYERKTYSENIALVEPTFSVPVVDVAGKISNGNVSGDIIANYQITPDAMVYASVSRGFKSGGVNGGVVFDPAEVTTFTPETITSYEAGVKYQTPDHRLTLNVSGFYYDYKDLQVYSLLQPAGGGIPKQLLDNAATARVYGLEGSSALAITKNIRFRGSLGLLSAKFTDYQSESAANDYTGNTLARAPKLTASLGLDASTPISSNLALFGSFDASYRTKVFFYPNNDPRFEQPGYWLSNARIAIGSQAKTWQVALWGKNIFNKKYYRDIVDFTNYGFTEPAVGEPATYGVEATFHF